MGINNTVKELLIQEFTIKKNVHNKKMNYSLLEKKKTQWILQLGTRNGLDVSVLQHIYSDIYNIPVMRILVNIHWLILYGLYIFSIQ